MSNDRRFPGILENKSTATVLNALHLTDRLSRVELARRTNMAASTVSSIVEHLVTQQAVRAVGSGRSTSGAGRRPVLYEIEPEAFYVVGIDLRVDEARIVVVNSKGRVVDSEVLTIDTAADASEVVLERMVKRTGVRIEQSGIDKNRLLGIGLSFLGLIDKSAGVAVYSSTLPQWQGVNFVQPFEEALGLPTFLENNANALTLGEARYGVGRDRTNVFGVWLSRGLGSGIVANKELYTGNFSTAGEFGHIIVYPNGPLCTCGNRGCLKTVASESTIEANAVRMIKSDAAPRLRDKTNGLSRDVTIRDIIEEADRGCKTCSELLNEAADAIGLGLVTVVNLISPEMVIFNESMLTSYPPFMNRIREQVSERIYSRKLVCPEIVLGTLGEEALAIGAASLVPDNILARVAM
jgi:predicted NBD/HSP70 family sugar kinase